MQGKSDIEYVMLTKTERVCIFKLPPLSQSKGYYLDDWKDMIWEGGIKITDKGNQQHLYFISQDGSTYAYCPIPKNYTQSIQKTLDSGRGYAVKLWTPNGDNLWIGVAFRDRNDAFDFRDCLINYQEKKDREINPEKFEKEFEVKQNFALEKGTKLIFGEKGAIVKTTSDQPAQDKGNLQDFIFQLPTDGKQQQPKAQQQQLTNVKITSAQTQSNSYATTTNKATTTNQFLDFNNWNQSAQQQNTQPQPQQQQFGGFDFNFFNQPSNSQGNQFSQPQTQQAQPKQQQVSYQPQQQTKDKPVENCNLLDF